MSEETTSDDKVIFVSHPVGHRTYCFKIFNFNFNLCSDQFCTGMSPDLAKTCQQRDTGAPLIMQENNR